jgi:chemotaxis protein MotB
MTEEDQGRQHRSDVVGPEPEPEFHEQIQPPPERFSRAGMGAAALVVVSLAAAGGLGYYAWDAHKKGSSASASLTQSQEELTRERTKSTDLSGQLTTCQKERDETKAGRSDTEKAAADAQATLTATRTEVEELRRERAETEKRLAAFKSIMLKFQKMIDTGKLKVLIRDGRMIVKLPAEIFFESGKAEITKEAAPAMREIASILRQFPDRRFEIAGHTDSFPLHNESFKSNWELSTARAVTVTEALVAGGMRPTNLVAAGYGPYDPVANNTSEPGRKENRRIEIVLLPNIKELPKLPPDATPAAASAAPKASATPAASAAPKTSAAPKAGAAPAKGEPPKKK